MDAVSLFTLRIASPRATAHWFEGVSNLPLIWLRRGVSTGPSCDGVLRLATNLPLMYQYGETVITPTKEVARVVRGGELTPVEKTGQSKRWTKHKAKDKAKGVRNHFSKRDAKEPQKRFLTPFSRLYFRVATLAMSVGDCGLIAQSPRSWRAWLQPELLAVTKH